MSRRPVRLAYLVSHPIQYQAPLLRRIAQEPDIDLTVFFCSDFSVEEFADSGFGRVIQWDVPLLDGYKYEFLPGFVKTDRVTLWRPFNYGLRRRLRNGHFDAIWIHGYMRPYHWAAIAAAKSLGMRVLVRDEATLFSRQRGLARKAAKQVFFWLLRLGVDAFLAIGSANAGYYRHLGVPRDRIFLVPYAVDNDFFERRATEARKSRKQLRISLGLDPLRPIVLFVSKLQQRKRPMDLMEAYLKIADRVSPRPYLLFVGDGELRPELERRIRLLPDDSVRFLGFRNQTELPQFLDLCDVFVLPSVEEPWGLIVNEVMNAGKPVVVTDQVGCGRDLVEEGVNGYVFSAGNVAVLAERLHGLLSDVERRAEMGKQSLSRIRRWSFEEDIQGLRTSLGLT